MIIRRAGRDDGRDQRICKGDCSLDRNDQDRDAIHRNNFQWARSFSVLSVRRNRVISGAAVDATTAGTERLDGTTGREICGVSGLFEGGMVWF